MGNRAPAVPVDPATGENAEGQQPARTDEEPKGTLLTDPIGTMLGSLGGRATQALAGTKKKKPSAMTDEARKKYQVILGLKVAEMHAVLNENQEKVKTYRQRGHVAWKNGNKGVAQNMRAVATTYDKLCTTFSGSILHFEQYISALQTGRIVRLTWDTMREMERIVKNELEVMKLEGDPDELMEEYATNMNEMEQVNQRLQNTLDVAHNTAPEVTDKELDDYYRDWDRQEAEESPGVLLPPSASPSAATAKDEFQEIPLQATPSTRRSPSSLEAALFSA